jgi:Leucine-rich repeat (LRR) protein
LPHLESLEIESCNLGNISTELLVDNPKLTMIKLGSNNFTVLGRGIFAKQVFLRELHLDGNMFNAAPSDALQYLFNLISLNLSSNYIMELTESSLDHVGSLQVLDLSNNAMDSVSERAFHNVTKLTSLNLQTNSIKNFPTRTLLPLVDLEHLSVNDNQLPHIPIGVQGLRKVKILNLSQNPMDRLKEIPESRAVMLTVELVVLTYTNLTTIGPNDLDLFPNVTDLIMSNNCLSRIAPYAFQSLNKLTSLDLSYNQVKF